METAATIIGIIAALPIVVWLINRIENARERDHDSLSSPALRVQAEYLNRRMEILNERYKEKMMAIRLGDYERAKEVERRTDLLLDHLKAEEREAMKKVRLSAFVYQANAGCLVFLFRSALSGLISLIVVAVSIIIAWDMLTSLSAWAKVFLR